MGGNTRKNLLDRLTGWPVICALLVIALCLGIWLLKIRHNVLAEEARRNELTQTFHLDQYPTTLAEWRKVAPLIVQQIEDSRPEAIQHECSVLNERVWAPEREDGLSPDSVIRVPQVCIDILR